MIEELTKNWKGAVIRLRFKRDKFETVRPAAFVYSIPGGFGWIEPAYAASEPNPSPIGHEVAAPIIEERNGELVFDGPLYSGEIEWFVGQPTVADALEWWEAWLIQNKTTRAEERARLVADGVIPA